MVGPSGSPTIVFIICWTNTPRIEMNIKQEKWLIICGYNPHTKHSESFMRELSVVVDKAMTQYKFVTVIGDLNNNLLQPKGTINKHLIDFMDTHGMTNLIKGPTCFKKPDGTLLDVIVTSNNKRFLTSGSFNTGLSDFHHLIYGILRTGFPRAAPRTVYYRSYKNFNSESYKNDLDQAPFHVMEIFDDIDDSVWYFDTLQKDILNSHAPLKSRIIRPNQPPFMNAALRKAAHRKAQLHNRNDMYPNRRNYEAYRVQRNKTANIRRNAIKDFFKEHCNKNCRNEPNFYKAIKPFMGGKGGTNSVSIQLMEGDRLVTKPTEVANVFNEFYVNITRNIGPPTDDTSHMSDEQFVTHSIDKYTDHSSILRIKHHVESSPENHLKYSLNEVSVDTVCKTLKKCDPKKATGYDQVPPRILREGAEVIARPITYLYNESIRQSHFPSQHKSAEVGPLHKKEDVLIKENYRPVSILTSLSKIFEKITDNQLSTFKSSIFSDILSAFRSGYNTQYVLMDLVEQWKEALDGSMSSGALLMDLSKAFDCIPHDLLIAKLYAYGMDKNSLTFFSSYLRNRKQRVKVQGQKSDWLYLTKGVPQGSILGPCLFNIFMNDFCWIFNLAKLGNYADDNTLIVTREHLHEVKEVLESEAGVAIQWFDENHMKANPSKFQFIPFSKKESINSIKLGECEIQPSNAVELLGITVDRKLNFSQHVEKIVKKAALKLNALRRKSKWLDTDVKKDYGRTFVLSNFTYCPMVWYFCNQSDKNAIEKIQERLLRLVHNQYDMSYDQLLEKSSMSSLELQRTRTLAIEVYKSVNNMSPKYIQELFNVKNTTYGLRDNSRTTVPKCKTTTYGLKSLKFEGNNIWNKLPVHIKTSQSLSTFKDNIRKHVPRT